MAYVGMQEEAVEHNYMIYMEASRPGGNLLYGQLRQLSAVTRHGIAQGPIQWEISSQKRNRQPHLIDLFKFCNNSAEGVAVIHCRHNDMITNMQSTQQPASTPGRFVGCFA